MPILHPVIQADIHFCYLHLLCMSGKAEFKGDDPLVNPRCIGFWIASILWFVRFFYYGFNYFIDDW